MQDTEKTRGGFNVAGWLLGALALIYFLFPVVYYVPVRALGGRHALQRPAVVISLLPIVYLCKYVPPYQQLILWEGHLTGLDEDDP